MKRLFRRRRPWRLLLTGLALAYASTTAAQLEWGSFKDNGCVGQSDQRNYSAVLWNIPSGQDWIATCLATSAKFRTRSGQYVTFPKPTTCAKSSITEALGVASLVTAAPGLAYVPAGAVSLVLGGGAYALDKADLGALNVWGLFHVQDPSCRGYFAEGHLQDLTVTGSGGETLLSQSYLENTQAAAVTRVCFRNHTDRPVEVRHDHPRVGTFRKIGKLGSQECGNFAATARVAFALLQDGRSVRTSKPMILSMSAFAGGRVTFDWKD